MVFLIPKEKVQNRESHKSYHQKNMSMGSKSMKMSKRNTKLWLASFRIIHYIPSLVFISGRLADCGVHF